VRWTTTRTRVTRNESYLPLCPQKSRFPAGNSPTTQLRRASPGSVLHTCHNPVLQTGLGSSSLNPYQRFHMTWTRVTCSYTNRAKYAASVRDHSSILQPASVSPSNLGVEDNYSYRRDLLLPTRSTPTLVSFRLSLESQPDRRESEVRTGCSTYTTLPTPSPITGWSARSAHSSHAQSSAFTTCFCRVTPTYSPTLQRHTKGPRDPLTRQPPRVQSFEAPAKVPAGAPVSVGGTRTRPALALASSGAGTCSPPTTGSVRQPWSPAHKCLTYPA